ncbi:unnamed protein product [Symbiodinium microadriaticum]|nr:unnamed protein product [Symbiodinium microadriaticum]
MPLRLGTFRQLVVLAEVMNAWNAIDVFVLSVAAALLEIEQFAEFIIGDSCDEIDKLLKQYFDDQLNGDDTCFEVTASLKTDFWVLCFAASLMLFGGLPMLSVCHAAIRDRQITNRTADQSLKGVSMSQLGEPGVEVQNPLADASVGITQDIRGVEKDILLFGDRLSANVVHVLVSMCLMVYVDEDSVLS